MKIFINIDKNCSEEQMTILNDYWLFEKNKAVIKVKSIQKKYKLSLKELMTLVKEYSYATRSDYICEKCDKAERFFARTSLSVPQHHDTDVRKLYNYKTKNRKTLCKRCEKLIIEEERAEKYRIGETKPYPMFEDWQPTIHLPKIRKELGIGIDNDELDDSLNEYFLSFKDFYLFKPNVKKTNNGWNKQFISHCERNLAWAQGKVPPNIKEEYFTKLEKLWIEFEDSHFESLTDLESLRKKIEQAIVEMKKKAVSIKIS